MRRVSNTAIASVTVVALCSGTWLLHNGTQAHPPPQPSAAQAGTGDALRQGAPALHNSPPERIRIPSMGVNAPLMALGLARRAASTSRPPGRRTSRAGTRPVPPPASEAPRSSRATSTTPTAPPSSTTSAPSRRAAPSRWRAATAAPRCSPSTPSRCTRPATSRTRRCTAPRPARTARHRLRRRLLEGHGDAGERGRLRPPHRQPLTAVFGAYAIHCWYARFATSANTTVSSTTRTNPLPFLTRCAPPPCRPPG